METISTKLVAAGVLGVLTLISGVLLTKAGRPLNSFLFNLHKMIAVVAIGLIIMSAVQLYKAGETKAVMELGLILLAGILFSGLVATGGMLSFEREWPSVVLKIHQVFPLLSLGISALSVFLLIRSQV